MSETPVQDHKSYSPAEVTFASLTVSDSRTPATDGSGAAVRDLVEAAGHPFCGSWIVADEAELICRTAAEILDSGVDVLVVSGGTGFSPRDVTVEALEPLLERVVVGFGELFRTVSHREIGAAAMLSRATAGVRQGRAVFVLPGSPAAVRLALRELILPEAAHLLGQARRPA